MKICDNHIAQIKTLLWAKGRVPAQDHAHATALHKAGKDAFGMVQTLLLANVAQQFPGMTLSVPAGTCPFCHGIQDHWMQAAVNSVDEELTSRGH